MFTSAAIPALKSGLPFAGVAGRIKASAQAAPLARKPHTLYEVLRVKQTASAMEIKTAYRSLAKRYHPDASPGSSGASGQDFIDINQAYATLSDPAERARYDLSIGVATWRCRGSPEVGDFEGRFRVRRWETDQCW
ncbi:Chaperone protein [Nymphaea thermarum]|nr:Chaperone protein [Nymphaea thermarum]